MLYIFDADGTLTPQRDRPLGQFSFSLLPGVAEKIARLRAEANILAIASNQPKDRDLGDIAGQFHWTADTLGISRSMVNFACSGFRRKPGPAMIQEIMGWTGCTARMTIFVGDQETDRQAAEAAGVAFVWASDFFKEM